ncbi:Pyridoxal phosphate phosphatase PHOSPHO2, partial [Dissostichus eleginoides]
YMQWFDSFKMESRRRWISSRESEGVTIGYENGFLRVSLVPRQGDLKKLRFLTGVSIGNEKQIPQTHQGDLKKLLKSFRLSNDSAERKTQSSYVRCARNNKSASSLNSSQLHGSQVSSSERARSHRGRDDAPHHRKNEAVSDDVCCGEPITVCDRPGTLYGFKEKRREKGKGRKNKKKFLDWSLEN